MASIQLSNEDETYVDALVKAGRYVSVADAVQEAIRLLRHKEASLADFDAAIERGLADCDAGRLEDIEVVRDRLVAKYRRMAA